MIENTLTDEDLVLLVNLLMPVAMNLRSTDSEKNFPETLLLHKLIDLRKEVVQEMTGRPSINPSGGIATDLHSVLTHFTR